MSHITQFVKVTSTPIASKASSNPFSNTSETSKTVLSVQYPSKTMNKTLCGSYVRYRFNKLKLTNKNSSILRKLDELGENYDADIVQAKQQIEDC